LKFSVFEEGDPPGLLVRGQLEGLFTAPRFTARSKTGEVIDRKEWGNGAKLGHSGAIEFLFEWGRHGALRGNRIAAAGHRVAHGGREFTKPIRIDGEALAALEKLVPLVPLHQPHNLAAIRVVAERAPELPQVACFDTSYHHTQPAIARLFALPRHYTTEGVCRYGFHGLSYEYIAAVLPSFDALAAAGRTIVAHLGNGASMCAMKNSQSVATTMGFSSLEGLPMGTRCGALDPGVLLFLMDRHKMDARALEKLLYKESGLLGVSGMSSDVRTLLASSDPRAAEAIDLFVYRIVRECGGLAAAIGGLDALVFTGGIGENAAAIRARVCRGAEWLGVDLDDTANESGRPRISSPSSRVSVWVIPTNEELMIAQHTLRVLATTAPERWEMTSGAHVVSPVIFGKSVR
jgi:acetate kinase